MILGLDTFECFLNSNVSLNTKYDIYLSSAIVSELDIDNDTNISPSINNYNKEFGSTTIVSAKFNNNLNYGENESDVNVISYIDVQRKKLDGLSWDSIARLPYTLVGSDIYYEDYLVENNTSYLYRAVPIVFDSEENEYVNSSSSNLVNITTKESNDCLFDAYGVKYDLLYDLRIGSIRKNKGISYVETLTSSSPYVLSSSSLDYESGSLKCSLVLSEDSKYGKMDVKGEHELRENFINWLINGEFKVLKTSDGMFKLISIDDGISLTPNNTTLWLYELSFNYTTVGDATNVDYLKECGMFNSGGD